MEISEQLPGLTDAQCKKIHEKASNDATRLLSLRSHPPSAPSTPSSPVVEVMPVPRLGPNEFGPGFASSVFEFPICDIESPFASTTDLHLAVSDEEARSDTPTGPPPMSHDDVKADIKVEVRVEVKEIEEEQNQQEEDCDEDCEKAGCDEGYAQSISQMSIPPLDRLAFGPEFASSLLDSSLNEASSLSGTLTTRPDAASLRVASPVEQTTSPSTLGAQTQSLCDSASTCSCPCEKEEEEYDEDEYEEEIRQPQKQQPHSQRQSQQKPQPPQKQFLTTFDFEFAGDDARYRLSFIC